MAINKIIYAGQTLIDLTADTVTADKVLQGITFHGKDGVAAAGTCTYDSDTQDATAAVGEILAGKTAYARGAKVTGTMPNNGGVTGTITTVDGEYTIPAGYHDGSGTVAIADTDQAKLVAANIREGVTILGVEGTMSGSEDITATAKTVTPTKDGFEVVPGTGFTHLTSVTVNPIPYAETANAAGGTTITIG